MEKVILVALIFLASCSKEDTTCNCGKIISDDPNDYSIVVRNSCSEHEKKFILNPGDWMTAYVGTDICISTVKNW